MLFRTVYGAELEAIYHALMQANHTEGMRYEQLRDAFVPPDQPAGNNALEDALSFLLSLHLIQLRPDRACYTLAPTPDTPLLPFRLRVLFAMRRLEDGLLEALHPIDPLYMRVLTYCYALPNQLYIHAPHSTFNTLDTVKQLGGLSAEKVGAWKRVMAYLGAGRRGGGGFLYAPSPNLILEILVMTLQPDVETPLQLWLEQTLVRYIPVLQANGDLTIALENALAYLREQGLIQLSSLQDSPYRTYFGAERVRTISYTRAASTLFTSHPRTGKGNLL